MSNLHFLAHIVSVIAIAILVKQLIEVNQKSEQYESCNQGDQVMDTKEPTQDGRQSHDPPTASVWCYDSSHQPCHFTDLCYNTQQQEFVMFTDENSVVENVQLQDGSFTVDLSSVKNHNAHQTTITTFPRIHFSKYNFTVSWESRTVLVFNRFLPGNLMHVFHDDLLPLHQTLKLITMGYYGNQNVTDPYNIQLFTFDNFEETDLDPEVHSLYQIFSKWKIKNKGDMSNGYDLVCYKDIYIGLSKTMTWYDFGFTKPQGPIDDSKVTSKLIHSTVNYILHHVKSSNTIGSSEYLVMVTRKENRKILNAMELNLEIAKRVQMKVINLSFELFNLPELINIIHNAKGIIGMHGSLLILSLFLKRGSFLIELFPYAVNPSQYTPYKTFADLKGLEIVYKAWANQNAEKSIGHYDWPQEVGGLRHLEDEEREIIMQQTTVPSHLCCSDPSWLYHIYQDTIVDTEAVASLVQSSVQESTLLNEKLNSNEALHPSKVKNVKCFLVKTTFGGNLVNYLLKISWTIPWTIAVMDYRISYDILIQDIVDESGAVIEKQSDIPSLTIPVDKAGTFYVWVRGVTDNHQHGPCSNSILCTESSEIKV